MELQVKGNIDLFYLLNWSAAESNVGLDVFSRFGLTMRILPESLSQLPSPIKWNAQPEMIGNICRTAKSANVISASEQTLERNNLKPSFQLFHEFYHINPLNAWWPETIGLIRDFEQKHANVQYVLD